MIGAMNGIIHELGISMPIRNHRHPWVLDAHRRSEHAVMVHGQQYPNTVDSSFGKALKALLADEERQA